VSNAIKNDMLDRFVLVGTKRAERRWEQLSFEERGIEVGAVEPETASQNRNRAQIREDIGARHSRGFEGTIGLAEGATMEELELAAETACSGRGKLCYLGVIMRDFPFSFNGFDGLSEGEMGLGRAGLGDTGVLLSKDTAGRVSDGKGMAAVSEGARGTVMVDSWADNTELDLEREAVRVGW
jgi:hypothetical protein